MGVVLALVGAAAFSVMNVAVRRGVRPGDRDNGVLTTVAINVAVFSVLTVGVVATRGVPDLQPLAIVAFAAAGLASTFLGRLTLFAGIRRAGAVRAAAVKNATPLVTLGIALTLLGERLTPGAAAGVVLVLLGIGLVVRESLGRPAPSDVGAPPTEDDAIDAELLADAEAAEASADRTSAATTMSGGSDAGQSAVTAGLALAGLAALTFGAGHALRKVGMDVVPDALLGATIGSWAALAGYSIGAVLRGTTSRLVASVSSRRPWFWLAGIAGGTGQLAFFAALEFAPVAHVSVVAASETILTLVFAALLTRRLEQVSRHLLVPALFVFVGVAVIALFR